MHEAAVRGRGPTPWRSTPAGPTVRLDPLVALAGFQFVVVVAWSAWLLVLADLYYGGGANALACFDGDEPACTDPSPFPLERFLAQAGAWTLVIVLAAAAVLVAWLRPRAARVALALPALAALVANRLAEIPLPY